jgi:dTDP-4-dehydrorhamnose reductase
MNAKKKLLVTGASGFLGWNICRIARREFEVIGVSNTNPLALDGIREEKCDLALYKDLRALFYKIRPDAVLHAAAIAAPNACQENPVESGKVNVDAAIAVAGLCNDLGIPCAFTSTDLVFDGTAAPYDESRPVSPISVYGEQKVKAETGMRERHDDFRICRMPLMYGDAPAGAQSFIQPFIKAIRDEKELTLFFDEYRTPVSATDAVGALLLSLGLKPGTYHCGGKESISRYDFCVKLAKVMNIHNAKLKTVSQKSVVAIAPRPLNVSLDSSKMHGMGFDPGSIDEELTKLIDVQSIKNA